MAKFRGPDRYNAFTLQQQLPATAKTSKQQQQQQQHNININIVIAIRPAMSSDALLFLCISYPLRLWS